ncbi:uncharacterized protein SCHCODRAFT_02107494 [Schizophyllum commune H4-8]|nr:uncharacterized protein SCHCODRAFT_02107494 [Schizophyllum commune H4-8]KAI5885888.1 hypothetical protein SCHCODRAFT_02107494 [Schizophyllum commune H4-8]
MYIMPTPGHFASDVAPSSTTTTLVSTLKRRVSTLARSIVSRRKEQEATSTARGPRRTSIGSHSSSQTCSTDATLVDDPDRVPVALFRTSRRMSAQFEPRSAAQPESHSSISPSPRPSVQLEPRLSLAEMRARTSSPPPPPTSFRPPTERCPAPTDRRLTLAEMRTSWSGPPSSYVPPRPTHSLSYPRSSEMPTRPRSLHGPSSFNASYFCWDPRRSSVSLSPSSPAPIQPEASTSSNVPAGVSGTVPASTMRRQLSISFADEASLVHRGEDAQRRRSSARASSMRAASHNRRTTSIIRRAASEPAVIALSEPAAIAPLEPAVVAPPTNLPPKTAVAHSSANAASQASALPNIGRTRTRRFFISRPKSWSGKKTLSSVDSTVPLSLEGNASKLKRQSSIAPVYVAAVGMVVNVA